MVKRKEAAPAPVAVAGPVPQAESRVGHELVLVVDDDDQVRKLVKRVLEGAGFECITVGLGTAAHAAAVQHRPDLILLDLMLGDTTGDAVLKEMRRDFRTQLIPIVFLTVRSSTRDKVDHLLAGADDYVTKPFEPEELVARLRAVLQRALTSRDLNPLTGMWGNTGILREISARLSRHERFACMYPDLDAFKSYNDTYGFVRGDDVIRTLGIIINEALEHNFSPHHFAGHVGGDDFIILTEPDLAEPIAAEIAMRFDAIAPSFYDEADRKRGWIEYEDRTGNRTRVGVVSVSIGIVIAQPGTFATAAALSSRAAEAKTAAKRMMGSSYVVDRRRPPAGKKPSHPGGER
jgi:diguanylate cyclase (GGDEF)-like protein